MPSGGPLKKDNGVKIGHTITIWHVSVLFVLCILVTAFFLATGNYSGSLTHTVGNSQFRPDRPESPIISEPSEADLRSIPVGSVQSVTNNTLILRTEHPDASGKTVVKTLNILLNPNTTVVVIGKVKD